MTVDAEFGIEHLLGLFHWHSEGHDIAASAIIERGGVDLLTAEPLVNMLQSNFMRPDQVADLRNSQVIAVSIVIWIRDFEKMLFELVESMLFEMELQTNVHQ